MRSGLNSFSALALAATLALTGHAALAQSNPNTFSLPSATPTPTPSPAVQGPEDERSGVRLAPQRIAPQPTLPEREPTAPPAPTPTPAPTAASTGSPPTAAPAASRTPSPALRETAPPASRRTAPPPASRSSEPQTPAPTPVPSPAPPAPAPSLAPDLDFPPELSEGFDPSGEPVGDGEWVDVEPGDAEGFDLPGAGLPDLTRTYGPPGYSLAAWIWAGLAFALLALVFVAWRAWLARPKPPLALESTLTDAVRSRISESYDPREPEPAATPSATHSDEPEPVAPAPIAPTPPRLDLSLNVSSATRSVMMFTLNFRLTINNRTNQAVRNLSVWGHLTCAQRGDSNAGSFGKGAPIDAIERIGPQQGHTIEGSVQLPMTQVKAIRQGAVPMFVPLVHITLEAPKAGIIATSFVVGTPSETNAMRLHPITLEGAPGTIRGLRANEIKPFVADEPA